MSDDFVKDVRDQIQAEFGDRYLPAKPNKYAAGKQAQEAHEAIRPTDLSRSRPEKIKGKLSIDQYKLYSLIYRRAVASQMTPAVFAVTNVTIEAGEGLFKTQGKILKFDGHRKVLAPGPASRKMRSCPTLAAGMPLDLHDLNPTQHFTQPPASVHRGRADQGAGEGEHRPAEHLRPDHPDDPGPALRRAEGAAVLRDRPGDAGDRRSWSSTSRRSWTYKFTAYMEDELDDIASAKEDMVKVLDEFYHPFQEDAQTRDRRPMSERVSRSSRPRRATSAARPMAIKFSRTGQFPGLFEATPECKSTRRDGRISRGRRPSRVSHTCPKCGKPAPDPREQARARNSLSCSGYPGLQGGVQHLGPPMANLPVALGGRDRARPAISAASRWPCGKARGAPFLGCTGYPKCRNTMPRRRRPASRSCPVKVDVKCEKCGRPDGAQARTSRSLPRLP